MIGSATEALLEKVNSGESLERADLRDLVLNHAMLENVRLCRSDLEGVNFEGANLRQADLSCANLREAYMPGVDLERANLQKANLEGANLEGANLQFADLRHANLGGRPLNGPISRELTSPMLRSILRTWEGRFWQKHSSTMSACSKLTWAAPISLRQTCSTSEWPRRIWRTRT